MQRPDYSRIPPEWQQVNEQVKLTKEQLEESSFESVHPTRSFHKSLAAATTTNGLTPILSTSQLKQCGLAYINNGIIRTIVDRTTYFINPERTGFIIEPNDELTVGLSDEEVQKLEQQINDDTLTNPDTGENLNLKELRRKTTRINKRVKLHSNLEKLISSALVYGRSALEIIRFGKSAGEAAGEPRALRHLKSLRIQEILTDPTTGEFDGLKYDDGKATASGPKKLKANQLIPAFHDDNNILDNSDFSGASLVWPVLEAANVMDVILAEDMPEIARQSHQKFGIIYAGTSKRSTIRKLKEELEAGTWLVHNEPNLKTDIKDLSNDPMALMNVNDSLAKLMSIAMNLPQFLLFEDTANFATANQVMQCYKSGMLKRYRTWLQGILEDYWYDPILANHLNIELEDVISAPIKIKATFQDINFETRLDVITADEKLQNMMVFTNVDTAKDIDRKDIANRLQLEQNEIQKAVFMQRNQDIKEQQFTNNNNNKPPVPNDKEEE